MTYKKLSFLHRLGNVIQSIIVIVENLIGIVTFSYCYPNWSMKFIMWRMDTIFYGKSSSNRSVKN